MGKFKLQYGIIPIIIIILLLPFITIQITKGFTAPDYTLNVEVGNSITYYIEELTLNSPPPVINQELLNVMKLLNTVPEPQSGYYIQNTITKINDSHLSFTRDIVIKNDTATYSWGSFLDSQNRSSFSITSWVMTSNMTLIVEESTNQNIDSFSVSTSTISFSNETYINDLVMYIDSEYDLESGWLKFIGLEVYNTTSDALLMEIVLYKEPETISEPVIDLGSASAQVNPEYYTIGVDIGSTQSLELAEYMDEEEFLQFPIGLEISLTVTNITQVWVLLNATYIYPNGTIFHYPRDIVIQKDEVYIPGYVLTTNTSLIEGCGVNQGFNISYIENFILFTQYWADAEENIYSLSEFTYDCATGFLMQHNMTRWDYNRTKMTFHVLLTAIDNSTSQTTTTMPTTSIEPDITSTITSTSSSLTTITPAIELFPLLALVTSLIAIRNFYRKRH